MNQNQKIFVRKIPTHTNEFTTYAIPDYKLEVTPIKIYSTAAVHIIVANLPNSPSTPTDTPAINFLYSNSTYGTPESDK